MAEKTFYGFPREDGTAGTRNYLAIIPTVFCANEVVSAIARGQPNSRPLLHCKGCGQLAPDLEIITRTLVGLGSSPNVGATLLVGLGCEAVSIDEVYAGIAQRRSLVEKLVIQEAGGMSAAVRKGRQIVERMIGALATQKRAPQPLANLRLAVKCGSSDATSGLAANPATGKAVDEIIAAGGTVIFGETTEFIGAEHILAARAIDGAVAQKILAIVNRMEKRIIQMGVDMRGTQPSPGNIAGGLTTIEEKSLGAISKSGHQPICDVYEYGEQIKGSGLFIMDSPGKEDEFLTGACAAGANMIVFTSGGGAPQGCPLVPVVKVAGNPDKVLRMKEHVDVDAGAIIKGTQSIQGVGRSIIQRVLRAASGEQVAAEIHQYDKSIGIYTRGPTI
ncbi:MAG: UxaA family hydrolase [Desulfobacterales bacterium]|nr:MAG: UxaA family hydrolase [Desulfobacterales bacterium]